MTQGFDEAVRRIVEARESLSILEDLTGAAAVATLEDAYRIQSAVTERWATRSPAGKSAPPRSRYSSSSAFPNRPMARYSGNPCFKARRARPRAVFITGCWSRSSRFASARTFRLAQERTLLKGQFVLTGTMTGIHTPETGQTAVADFGDLAKVEITFY